MKVLRSVSFTSVTGGLVILGLVLPGCGGATGSGSGGGSGTDTSGSKELVVSYNDDPSSNLVASAKSEDGTELAIYGEKDANGDLKTVTQIDVAEGAGDDVTSIELDDDERPVHMEVGSSSDATFAYDDDADTVRVEVQESSGATEVDESFDVLSEEVAGKARPVKGAVKINEESLCKALRASRDVLEEFFDCDPDTDPTCDKGSARVPKILKELCEERLREVDDLSISLGETPEDIPLGVRAHFTTRGAADSGITVVLIAVAFGGARPMESIVWSQLAGPGEVPIEDLPSGTAIADLLIPGIYTFRVTVTDADGTQVSADIEVAPEELPEPVINATPDGAEVGRVITFSGAESSSPGDDPIEFFHWRFGDDHANTGPDVSHAFTEEGEFVVSLLVSTESGRRATTTKIIHVGEPLDCVDECQIEAENVFLDCLIAGGSEENCAARSHALLQECFEQGCGGSLNCEQHCEEVARDKFNECVAVGNSEAACEDRVFEVMDRCLREQCSRPPECEEDCHHQAEGLFFECREQGKSEEECIGESHTFMRGCVNENCDDARNCEEHCEEQAGRIFEECRHNGGNEEECAGRAHEHIQNCLERDCFNQGDCDQICGDEAERVFHECIADGGSEGHCEGRSGDFFDHCLLERCEGPEDCVRVCEDEAHRFFDHCMEAGGTEEECADTIHDFVEICLRETCDGLPDCEFMCHERARYAFEDCLFNGGTEDECIFAIENELDFCLREECSGQEHACEEECWEQADRVFDRCLVGGGTEDECAFEADHFVGECLFDSCGQAPGCEQHCEEMAEDAFEACVNAGTPEAECIGMAFDKFDTCMAIDCDRDQPPDCEAFCEEQAIWVFEDCTALGGSDERCIGAARDTFEICIQEECDGVGGPSCEEFCGEHADIAFGECLVNGGTENDCGQFAGMLFDICLQEECDIAPPPPPDDCDGFCNQQADLVYDECIARGGFLQECEFRADDAFGICIAEQCRDDLPPPPPDDCEGFCRQEAEMAFDACLATGALTEDCALFADDEFVFCLDRECGQLPPPPPDDCEGMCHDKAAGAFDDCVLSGGSQGQCELISDDEFTLCMTLECQEQPPPPPPTDDCEALCRDLAGRTVDDCLAGGGAQAECDGLGDDEFGNCMTVECQEPPPPPPPPPPSDCEESCRVKAQADFDACVNQVDTTDDCAVVEQETFDRCLIEECP